MQLTVFQKGFNFSEDGPGNRLVLHLQGCNMRCPWCANPEGMPMQPPLMQLRSPLPDWLCPHGAIADGALDRAICDRCTDWACQKETRNQYLRLAAETKPLDDWEQEILKASALFFSGGGVTFSGGEVGMQLDAATELLRRLKAHGIHTAIESNLTHPDMARIYPFVDLLIADYKHHDDGALHSRVGVGNRQTERNLILARQLGMDVLVRIPLVNGFNAEEDDAPRFAQALRSIRDAGACGRFDVELLRYHEFGREKWAQCALPYEMQGGFVPPGRERAFAQALEAYGLTIAHT